MRNYGMNQMFLYSASISLHHKINGSFSCRSYNIRCNITSCIWNQFGQTENIRSFDSIHCQVIKYFIFIFKVQLLNVFNEYSETYGEEVSSIRQTASLWKNHVSGYIGPQETCVHEGRMAAAFNLPMISYVSKFEEFISIQSWWLNSGFTIR